MLLTLTLNGCLFSGSWVLKDEQVRDSDMKEGRILLRVSESGRFEPRDVEGAKVTVGTRGGALAVAETNAIGAAGLEFRAPAKYPLPMTSDPFTRDYRPWVRLKLEKAGFETLEIELQPEDFVEARGMRLLTRGVRRAS